MSEPIYRGGWSPEVDARAIELHGQGRSCSEIAAALGNGRTRNSVIGRLSRLGFKRTDADTRSILKRLTGHRGPRSALSKRKPPTPPKPKPVAMESPSHEPRNIRLTELRLTSCRWPTMDVDNEIRFCGLPTEGAVYCRACIQQNRPFILPKPRRAA